MSYATVVAFTKNQTYRDQVEAALQEVSQFILDGNGGVPLSVNQLTNAFLNKRNPLQFIDWFIFAVAQDATIQADGANPTDAHIRAVIDAKWKQVWS